MEINITFICILSQSNIKETKKVQEGKITMESTYLSSLNGITYSEIKTKLKLNSKPNIQNKNKNKGNQKHLIE